MPRLGQPLSSVERISVFSATCFSPSSSPEGNEPPYPSKAVVYNRARPTAWIAPRAE